MAARSYSMGGPSGAGYVVELADREFIISIGYVAETLPAAGGIISVWSGSVGTGRAWAQKPVMHWTGSAWV